MPRSDYRRSAQRFAPRPLVNCIGRVVPPEGRFSPRIFTRLLASLGIIFQVAYPEDVKSSGGGELHILLAGYVDVDQWEDSTGSDPDADGRYHSENGSLADESGDPPADDYSDDGGLEGGHGFVSDDSPRDLIYANTSGVSDSNQAMDSEDSYSV
jgi:hypothetical protein